MGLGLDLEIGAGRRSQPVVISDVWELDEIELQRVAVMPRESTVGQLKRISDRHHALARLIAGGTSEAEASLITGYVSSRISILKQSPAFQELVEFYREKTEEKFLTFYDHLAGVATDAVLELRERLEDTPEDFSNKELLTIVNDMADRTGHPRQKDVNTTVNVNLGDRLAAARRRAQARLHSIPEAEIIDEEVVKNE